MWILIIIFSYIMLAGLTAKIYMIRKHGGKTFKEVAWNDKEHTVILAGLFWPVFSILALGSFLGDMINTTIVNNKKDK